MRNGNGHNGAQETAYPRTVDARDCAIMLQVALKAAVDSVPPNTDTGQVLTRATQYHEWLLERCSGARHQGQTPGQASW